MKFTSLDRAAAILGGYPDLQRELKIEARSTMAGWRAKGRAPTRYCAQIERLTRAKGTVVTCHELRPDIFPAPGNGDEPDAA